MSLLHVILVLLNTLKSDLVSFLIHSDTYKCTLIKIKISAVFYTTNIKITNLKATIVLNQQIPRLDVSDTGVAIIEKLLLRSFDFLIFSSWQTH